MEGGVNYEDYTLVRLADEAIRASLFDQVSLEQMLVASYDVEVLSLSGPYSAVFERLFLGLSVPRRALVEGCWGLPSSAERHEARITVHGLGVDSVHVDALWRGAIVAQASRSSATIDRVTGSWADLEGIDEEIIAALGALPSDPAVLEAQRRMRLLDRLRAGFRQPEALSEAWLDGWLAQHGVATAGELLVRMRAQSSTGAFEVGFSEPASETPAPRALPLTVALLIRGEPLSVSRLLADSKLVREHLDQLGVGQPPDPAAAQRQRLLVAWMVPEQTFDDPDWPGGDEPGLTPEVQRERRRAAAGAWMAREGIGLVVTPASTGDPAPGSNPNQPGPKSEPMQQGKPKRRE